jgi:hypothetical protein
MLAILTFFYHQTNFMSQDHAAAHSHKYTHNPSENEHRESFFECRGGGKLCCGFFSLRAASPVLI